MNILYLGRDTLACRAVIFMLGNHFQEGDVTFTSVDDITVHHSAKHYDVAILDDENAENNVDSSTPWLNFVRAPLVLLTSKTGNIRKLHEILPKLHGVIDRNGSSAFFIKAVSAVACGGYCYSWDVLNIAGKKARQFDDIACKKANLTAREKEILKLCLEGKTNKSISLILHRSAKTISAHKSNMLKKLGIKSWQLYSG